MSFLDFVSHILHSPDVKFYISCFLLAYTIRSLWKSSFLKNALSENIGADAGNSSIKRFIAFLFAIIGVIMCLSIIFYQTIFPRELWVFVGGVITSALGMSVGSSWADAYGSRSKRDPENNN